MPAKHRAPLPDTDTIVAIITPPGRGGIAALRVAGAHSLRLYQRHLREAAAESPPVENPAPFLMRHLTFVRDNGECIDDVMAVFMPHGRSYTGRDQFEIFCHGGETISRAILEQLVASGARPAEPGEFTRIAFLEGRIDLAQAEGVADIIHASGQAAARAAERQLSGSYSNQINNIRDELITFLARLEADIDYPDEEVPDAETVALLHAIAHIVGNLQGLRDSYRSGRIFKDGYLVAIAGRPNAGKSSLFNALLKQERAIVSPIAGTTRDYLSEWLDISGYAVNIVDTAGLRKVGGVIERAGKKRSIDIIAKSDLVLWLHDNTVKGALHVLTRDVKELRGEKAMLVLTKADLKQSPAKEITEITKRTGLAVLQVSARTGKGISQLVSSISARITQTTTLSEQPVVVTSERHVKKIEIAIKELRDAMRAIKSSLSPEIPAFHVRQAVGALEEITGRVYTDDVLDKIFSQFCIGK